MPCHYYSSPLEEAYVEESQRHKESKRELNRVTMLLCYVMTNYHLEDPPKDLLEWWEDHQKRDVLRRTPPRRKKRKKA